MAKAKIEKVELVASSVTVELLSIREGIDFISHKFGTTKFENGLAEVSVQVAAELKESGLVKLVN